MPHIPYAPKPLPGAASPVRSRAPLMTAAAQPDTIDLGPDLFDLPLTPVPKRPASEKRSQITPGQPRRRQYGKEKLGAGKHTISMKSFEKSPEEIVTGLGLGPLG